MTIYQGRIEEYRSRIFVIECPNCNWDVWWLELNDPPMTCFHCESKLNVWVWNGKSDNSGKKRWVKSEEDENTI